ncbi:MAG: NDP-sugar synthase [Candidatus Aminicenantes bacterium]|nr:NDP-sugar synthase [Candidatus Aminicenantes bacterium]MCK5004097.1 NDP-sugar synthase [Candidatus Aminicenantes bacterium]
MTDFFILAGGFGKRAEPLTNSLPKPLFPLDGIPLLGIIARQLTGFGLERGFINVHHLAPLITNFPLPGLDITYLEEEELSGNRILSTISSDKDKYTLVINGDTFLDIPYYKLFREMDENNSAGVILVRKKDGPYSSIITRGNDFLRRDKNPEVTDLMYTGVSIFRSDFLKELSRENLFDSLEASGKSIRVLEYGGLWLDIGSPENYFLSNEIFRESEGKSSGNSVSEGVSITQEAEVTNSIIWSDTKISGDTVIRDSIVTGGLFIRSGTFIKKVITMEGTFDLKM